MPDGSEQSFLCFFVLVCASSPIFQFIFNGIVMFIGSVDMDNWCVWDRIVMGNGKNRRDEKEKSAKRGFHQIVGETSLGIFVPFPTVFPCLCKRLFAPGSIRTVNGPIRTLPIAVKPNSKIRVLRFRSFRRFPEHPGRFLPPIGRNI